MKKVILFALLVPFEVSGQGYAQAGPGDVVITEIMADPVPAVSLPEVEYIEITNASAKSFDLSGWKLQTGGKDYLLPRTALNPDEILILCSVSDTVQMRKYGRTAGLKQFPSLTDAGRLLCLSNSSGELIHGVEYSSGWYRNELKDEGGWSLEMIDLKAPFCSKENWTASVSSSGGTPGKVNTARKENDDVIFTGILNAFPEDSINVVVRFSEPVISWQEKLPESILAGKKIKSLLPADPLLRSFLFQPYVFLEKGKQYELEIPAGLQDFAGNPIRINHFMTGLSERAVKGDILFNELLFNPLPGDEDYIELFNASGKIIDVSRLNLVSVNDGSADTSELYPVSDEKRCFLPGTYYLITTDSERTAAAYPSSCRERIFEAGDLPSMSDDEGHLILYNRELDIIDEVSYSDKMHYSLISDDEGVSLEKTSPGATSSVPGTWHSASESSGWGTPGAPNSVFEDIDIPETGISFSSTRITPDGDGIEDFLSVGFRMQAGDVLNITVFDESGNPVKKLASNLLAGAEGSVIWDGTADDGSPVRTGIYVVLITSYNLHGNKDKWKRVCTVIRR